MKEDIKDWQIGRWIVQPSLNQITGPDGPHRTTPKVIAVLLCLAKHQGDVVSRDTLLQTVWADTIVSDDSLNRAISDLRGIFNDHPQNAQVIETIRQRGYRLLLPAHPLHPKPTAPMRALPSGSFSWKTLGGLAVLVILFCVLALSRSTALSPVPPPTYRSVPLTTLPGFEFDVALSHDGQQIAYGHYDNPQGQDIQIDLFAKQIGIETPQQLTNNRRIEMSPAWSPDGRSIAFLGWQPWAEECGLFVLTLVGGDEHKMADCETFLVTGVSWSPDGKTIAFSDRKSREEPFRIYLLDVETRAITPLTAPPTDLFGDFSATFSPDGKSIGFIRGTVAITSALLITPAVGDVYTINIEDLTEQRLTFENQEIPHIDWMPDGSHLVFASNRERGAPGLWKVDMYGNDPEWLFGSHTFIRKPMFARNGQRLVFEQWNNEASIWHVHLDSLGLHGKDATEPLIQSTHFDATPQYSPDGQKLAFTSKRSGANEIWISDADGQRPMQLTSFNGPFTSSPRWSPDGSALTFETRIDGQTDVYSISAEGGVPKRLTQSLMEDMVPSWSADGQWIYFASNRTGAWQIWKKRADGSGQARQVTQQGAFLPLASPNPSDPAIYYTRIDKKGLFRIPIEGGTEELVLSDLLEDDWGNWIMAEDGIYLLTRLPSQIQFYDFATRETTTLGALQKIPGGMVGITLSPDRRTLAFVQQSHRNADIWMIDNVL